MGLPTGQLPPLEPRCLAFVQTDSPWCEPGYLPAFLEIFACRRLHASFTTLFLVEMLSPALFHQINFMELDQDLFITTLRMRPRLHPFRMPKINHFGS
jgi:hypothetical protein